MHKLIIEDDEGRTTVVPLVRDELTIGRQEGNTIRLTERNVSRRHARLFRQNADICVEDLGSYTGVRVNGARISVATPMRDSDQIAIGDYKLSVRSEGAADVVPATVPATPADLARGDGGLAAASAGPPGEARFTAPAHLDAAPTIPLRTLEEQGRAPQIASAAPPRLVVVTSDLAGMEFRLDRPSLVIGRTDENDIILNHASISRHHAKVVRDGDRTTIVDLQSANGVRVAGESYERVDVQPGDLIELGHVKLRFVGPWEEWTFDPHAYAPRSRRNLKLGAAAGGIVLAVVLALTLQGKKQPPPTAPVTVAAPPKAPAGPAPAALLAEATAAAESENWDKAVSALDLLLSRPAGDAEAAAFIPRATDLKRKVDLERRGAEVFASFQQAVTDKEPDVALSRYDEIPADSAYKARAEPALAEVKSLFLVAHLDLADAARTQGRCDEATAEVEKVQQIDPENRQARDIVRKCHARPVTPARVTSAATPSPAAALRPVALAHPVAQPGAVTATRPAAAATKTAAVTPARPAATAARPAAPRTTPHTVKAAPTPPRGAVAAGASTEPPPANATSGGEPEAADLIRQAREAWMHQQCGSAIELSRRALKLRPGNNDAHQIIAVCACSTKDREGALKSYSRLDERSRAMVRTLCARNGVELVE